MHQARERKKTEENEVGRHHKQARQRCESENRVLTRQGLGKRMGLAGYGVLFKPAKTESGFAQRPAPIWGGT